MSEFPNPEHLSRKERQRVSGVRAVLRGLGSLATHVTGNPFPAMSDHHKTPEPDQQKTEQPTLPGMEIYALTGHVSSLDEYRRNLEFIQAVMEAGQETPPDLPPAA